jgi:exodeoxyribonuclease V gamma subunit
VLHVHRAERADRLVDALAGVLATPPEDPLAPELVAVHSRGIERWLAQELSTRLGASAGRGDGVCANVEFPFPSRVVGRALAAAADVDPDADPWTPARLVWPLLDLLETHLDESWLGLLRAHVGDGDPTRRGRRFGAARHLADLFDRYAVHRPAMLQAWAAGREVDAAGRALDDDTVWQPRLWSLLRKHLDVPSPAERLDAAVAALRDGLDVPELPTRLSLFGLTALPASYLDVLAALATTRAVHLLLLHPSPVLWQRVAAQLAASASPRRVRREDDPSRGLTRHPLLASWGRDAREMQLVVAGGVGADDAHAPLGDGEPATLLARIQADLRTDRVPDAASPLDSRDRSLQVHACHGRTRQVEVLRDALLHLLADDPTLQPRDVVVLCPDIETFAPIVSAVFGAGGDGALPDLRVRLADRSLRQTNPVLRVVADLLTLAGGRLTASEVLDLAAREPVRRRFRFDDAELERLEAWVAEARVCWGLDADDRTAFGLGGVTANTWQAGLDRLLLGVTMADEDDRLVGEVVPLDDVEGSDVDLAGRLAELVARLGDTLQALRRAQPVAAWRDALVDAADALTATADHDRWQRLQLHRLLDDVVTEATPTGGEPSAVALTLPEVRTLLEDRLRGRPTRANHRTGDLTVCTLVPMRSVPHRVVCLLGMDDGAFPRRTTSDGDDLIDRDPHVGDRDARTEDRQLLLDALLAAGDHLVVTYTGRDPRTNEPRPPAVPIGELLDVADRTGITASGARARAQVLVEHPLAPYDPRNFTPGGLVPDRRWAFDPTALAGARACAQPAPVPPFLDAPLAANAEPSVDLADLVRFFEHPVKAFLRRRLEVSLPRPAEELADVIPVELAGLDGYAVGDRLLRARLAGADVERWAAVERARGVLPPGALADTAVADVTATVDALLAAAAEHADLTADQAVPLDVDVALPDGRRLVGAVPDVAGDTVLALSYARVAAKHRLAAWLRLLAATATQPERAWTAVTVGRCRSSARSKQITVVRIAPLADTPDARRRLALDHLACAVDLYDRGLRAPLPLYCATSAAYAEAAEAGEHGPSAAAKAWTTNWRYPNEDRDAEHVLALGGLAPFDALLTEPPCDDEHGEGWPPEEPHRFGRYARRLWAPLLTLEEVTDA